MNFKTQEDADVKAVTNSSNAIEFVFNQTTKVCLVALTTNASCFEHIRNPSYGIQLVAIQENSELIRFIDDPVDELCMVAVKRDPHTLQYIRAASDAVKFAAINIDGTAIRHVANPSVELCVAAIEQNIKAAALVSDHILTEISKNLLKG